MSESRLEKLRNEMKETIEKIFKAADMKADDKELLDNMTPEQLKAKVEILITKQKLLNGVNQVTFTCTI